MNLQNSDMNQLKMIETTKSASLTPAYCGVKQDGNIFMSLNGGQTQNSITQSVVAPATKPQFVRPPPGPPSNKTDLVFGGPGGQNSGTPIFYGGGGNDNNNRGRRGDDSSGEESDEHEDRNLINAMVNVLGIQSIWRRKLNNEKNEHLIPQRPPKRIKANKPTMVLAQIPPPLYLHRPAQLNKKKQIKKKISNNAPLVMDEPKMKVITKMN